MGLLWRDLYARAEPNVFLSWEWMDAWLAELGTMPLILVGEAAGALVLLGLLMPRARREAMGLVQVDGLDLHATGRREADVIALEYNGFLVDRGWAGLADAEAVAWLLGARHGERRFNELRIQGIAEPQALALTPAGALVRELSRKPSWRVDLAGLRASGRNYLDTLSANTRQQIRRAMRAYEQRGPLRAERAADRASALAWLDELAALHQRQWQAKGEPGGWAFPFFAGFQRRLLGNCMETGTAEIVRVTAGAHILGYVYNLISGGHVMAFVTGLATEADNRLKPGLVSHTLCIQRHLEEGRDRYDFLAGAYRYKASMGTAGPDFLHLLLQRPTPMTRFEQALRAVWERGRGLGRR